MPFFGSFFSHRGTKRLVAQPLMRPPTIVWCALVLLVLALIRFQRTLMSPPTGGLPGLRPAVEDLFGCSSADCKMSPVLKIPCYRLCRFAALFAGISGTRPCSTCCGKQCSRKRKPLHIHIASSYCNMPARMERQGPQPARSTKPALAHSWTEGVWHHKQKVVLFLSACQELLVRGSSEKPRGPESTSEGLILPSASLPLPSTSQPSFGCAYFQHAPAFCNPLVMPASSASVRREPEHVPLGLYCHKARR